MSSCHLRRCSFEFARETIDDAVRSGRLLTLELEFNRYCNFRCPYCYSANDDTKAPELTKDEFRKVLVQAKELGAGKVIVLGGEPMLYPEVFDQIEFMQDLGLEVDMFTNGSQMSEAKAQWLYNHGVNIVLKMNSFKEEIQDLLTGVKGSYALIQNALLLLREAGYPSEDTSLAVGTVICQQNIAELTTIWRWLRQENILPYFEMITPQGEAVNNSWLSVGSKPLKEFFEEISRIDRAEFGYEWTPQPPLVGNRCMRHKFSCLVTSTGDVLPCVGVTIALGNVRESSLRSILRDSEVVQDLKDHRNMIKGPCRTCDNADQCYGCRGAAYQITGDYLASDPLCWRNVDRQDEVLRLPVGVSTFIPQKAPMCLIDTLASSGERTAEVTVTLDENMPFLKEESFFDEAAYMELIAQAIAAEHGFRMLGASGQSHKGFLLGARNVKILGEARVGDTLKVSVRKTEKYGGFGVVKGTVSRNGEVLAIGDIKVWHEMPKTHHKEDAG